jgi:hypothetical protein
MFAREVWYKECFIVRYKRLRLYYRLRRGEAWSKTNTSIIFYIEWKFSTSNHGK